MELLTVFVIQLFIIVDPLAGIPIFLAITPGKTKLERRAMARRSCIVAFLVIVFFLVAGASILDYFGIKTSAVRICGGILLFIISLELLYGRATGTETSSREEQLAEEKEDVSVTPLAIPLLAGPGAIATTLAFAPVRQAARWPLPRWQLEQPLFLLLSMWFFTGPKNWRGS
jgi:multiple antibiotic resistance protein